MRIIELLSEARSSLKGTEVNLEAELLMDAICGISHSQQFSHPEKELTGVQVKQFRSALQRRLSGEPIAHIIGSRGFWDMELRITADVLIPRPDTECLVEQALARIPVDADWQVADLGTGSGAIAIALARERPECEITATDISTSALLIAEENARMLGSENIKFASGMWTQPLQSGDYDMIVSNPPYIRADDLHLEQGDLPAEPIISLVSGEDGLQAIRQIIVDCQENLKPGGWLLLEHGFDQAAEVAKRMLRAGLNEITTYQDYGGNDRVTAGRKAGKNEKGEK